MTAATCQRCAAALPADHRFCGYCGAPVGAAEAPTVVGAGGGPTVVGAGGRPTVVGAGERPTVVGAGERPAVVGGPSAVPAGAGSFGLPGGPAAPGRARRYRGPLWLGGVGAVLLVAGAGVVSAIFSAVQLEAAPGILVDIFGPVIEEELGGTVVGDVLDVTGTGGTDAESLGLAALIGVVAGAIAAAVGLLMVIVAGAWAANRARGGRRGGAVGTVTIAAPPTPVTYPAPAFAKAAPPTWTQAPPPAAPAPGPPPRFQQPQPPTWTQAPPPDAADRH